MSEVQALRAPEQLSNECECGHDKSWHGVHDGVHFCGGGVFDCCSCQQLKLKPRSWGSMPSFYVASRASVEARPAMWRAFRDQGHRIVSTWIDEAGEGQTADLNELWVRIFAEIEAAEALILYVEETDLPLKGAYVEVGAALAQNKPVRIIANFRLDRSLHPLGSWAAHPLVEWFSDPELALSVPLGCSYEASVR